MDDLDLDSIDSITIDRTLNRRSNGDVDVPEEFHIRMTAPTLEFGGEVRIVWEASLGQGAIAERMRTDQSGC